MPNQTITIPTDNIWMITREYAGFADAGGVKDVVKQLAEALGKSKCKISVVLPLYGFMNHKALNLVPLALSSADTTTKYKNLNRKNNLSFEIDMPYVNIDRQEYVRIYMWQPEKSIKNQNSGRKNVEIYLIDAERFLEKKDVYTYTAAEEKINPAHRHGTGHYDYFAMNVLLQKAAIALMISLKTRPDIIHCHDGHTAILPAMIREIEGYRHYFKKTGLIVTIHNAGLGYHQEVADLPFAQTITGLPKKIITDNLLDNKFNPFLAASRYAVINTVSKNYARELRETADDKLTGWLGHRLMARGVKLAGVTNGINPEDFNPSNPGQFNLAAGFSILEKKLAGKKQCRQELIKLLAATVSNHQNFTHISQTGKLDNKPEQPLFTFIGRFSAQKGVDKLLEALYTLLPLEQNFQIVILGTGDSNIEKYLGNLAKNEEYKGRICLLRGYSATLALKIYAAGDFFLIPSRYEPCGLTDYIAQLFGNLPIVHHIGGLVKVIDNVTGFAYQEHNSAALMGGMQKAISIFRESPEKITDLQIAAVKTIYKNHTWDVVIKDYLTLYRQAVKQHNLT